MYTIVLKDLMEHNIKVERSIMLIEQLRCIVYPLFEHLSDLYIYTELYIPEKERNLYESIEVDIVLRRDLNGPED